MKYTTTTTLKALKNDFYVSDGNEKLKKTEKVNFLIWNIPARVTCPYATEQCKHFCYAVKAENLYKDCLPCRTKNLEFTKSESFVSSMIQFISIKLNNLKEGKKIYFRIHESGDFYNRKYTKDWLAIMRYFESDKRIVFMAYTKSVRFFVGEYLPKNFCLRYSIWDDTKEEEIAIAKSLNLPIYTALTKEVLAKHPEYFVCKCESCGDCSACYHNGVKMIACIIH